METVPVGFLTDLLIKHNDGTLPPEHVAQEVALALQVHGYPADAPSVTHPDAVAILEWLDAGIVKSTPKQRAGLAGGFRHRPAAPGEVAGPPAPKPSPPALRSVGDDGVAS